MIAIIINVIESIIGVFANSMVLIAFKCYPHIRQSTTCRICGLSIADIIGAFTVPLLEVLRWCRGTNVWIYIAHVRFVLVVLFTIGNVVFSALIALERLLTLSFPLSYMTFITTERAAACVVATWVYLIVTVTILSVISHSFFASLRQILLSEVLLLPPNLPYTFMITHFYILLAVTVLSYLLIARIAIQKLRKERHYRVFGSQWKITKMVVTVGIIFFICYMPSVVINYLLRLKSYATDRLAVYYVMALAIYCISAVTNPFLYAAKTTYFRIAFRKLLPTWFVRHAMPNNDVDVIN